MALSPLLPAFFTSYMSLRLQQITRMFQISILLQQNWLSLVKVVKKQVHTYLVFDYKNLRNLFFCFLICKLPGRANIFLPLSKILLNQNQLTYFFFHFVKRKIVPYLKVKKSKIAFVSIEKLLYWLNLNRACQNHIWEVIQNSRYNNASAVNPGLKESKMKRLSVPQADYLITLLFSALDFCSS